MDKDKLKIIAEIGINWNGEFDKFEEMIRQCKVGGADYVKFQWYDAIKLFGQRNGQSRLKFELSKEQILTLESICNAYGIEWGISVFDRSRFDFVHDKAKPSFIKIASRTLSKDKKLVDYMRFGDLPLFGSLGMISFDELPSDIVTNMRFFNCISEYPTSVLSLKKFNYDDNIVGLSDHSLGIGYALHNISLGANWIEKHFTLNKSSSGRDHPGSMDVRDLRNLREIGDEIFMARRFSK